METLIIFFAIIAIQMIAAYTKQKKKTPTSVPSPVPQEAAPVPDPFREIREMMGLPTEPEQLSEPEYIELEDEPDSVRALPATPYAPESENNSQLSTLNSKLKEVSEREGLAPTRAPRIISEHTSVNERIEKETEPQIAVQQAVKLNNVAQGIVWAAILQEPRFKKRWTRR